MISVFQRMAFGTIATLGTHGVSADDLMRAELHRALDQAVGQLDEEEAVEGRLLDGSRGEVLARESAQLDLLLMGSRGYGPRKAVLLGSTTQALTRTALCPGLVLPRG